MAAPASATAATPRRQPSAYLGMAAIAADQFGLGLISPLLPFRVSAFWVGVVLSGQYLAVVLGQLGWGVLSDYIGRRRSLVVVMGADAALFVATAFASTPALLLATRVGVGLFAPISLSISWVADVSTGLPLQTYRRHFAHVGLSFNLGALLGAACGGLLGPERWLAANIVSAAPSALACCWALVSPEAAHVKGEPRGVRATAARPQFQVACLQFFASGALLGSFYSLGGVLLASAHGATAAEIAILSLASALWNILNNLLLIRPLLGLLGALRTVVLLAAIAAMSNAVLAVGQSSLVLTYAIYPVYYVSGALCLTVLNMMSSAYAQRFGENAVGTVNGIARAVFSVGFGAAPIVSVALWELQPWAPFAVGGAAFVIAASLTTFVILSGDTDPVPGKLSECVPTKAASGAESLSVEPPRATPAQRDTRA